VRRDLVVATQSGRRALPGRTRRWDSQSGAAWDLAPGSIGADRAGVAIGRVGLAAASRGGKHAGAAGPVFLAGREQLLADLDDVLAARPGQSGPRLVALYGLAGAARAPRTG
jgi:hypothetical protein